MKISLKTLCVVALVVGISSVFTSNPIKLYVVYIELLMPVMAIYVTLFSISVARSNSTEIQRYFKIIMSVFIEYILAKYVFKSLVNSVGGMSEKAYEIWVIDEFFGKSIVIVSVIIVMTLLLRLIKRWIQALGDEKLLILDHTVIPENDDQKERRKPVEYHYRIKNSWLTVSQIEKV